ncbi:MAG: small multi-drug export protein [Erysipelotrichaceae bacterium]|nr:small multi-drug export protein [Erysipelotrichaceae bacterium]
MTEAIFNFFSGLSREFALFMISLIPLIEERGALIFAAATGFEWYKALPICILANMLPVPFLLLFGMKIVRWLKTTRTFGGFFTRYEEKLNAKSEKVAKYGFFALTMFVGIPVPGTGAWSGSLVSTILGFEPKKGFVSILLGVIMAGIILTVVLYGGLAIFGIH